MSIVMPMHPVAARSKCCDETQCNQIPKIVVLIGLTDRYLCEQHAEQLLSELESTIAVLQQEKEETK